MFVCRCTADHAAVLTLGERDGRGRSRVFGGFELVEVVCEKRGCCVGTLAIQTPRRLMCGNIAVTPTIDLELAIYRTSDPSTSL
jgi:hypothetical protein